MILSTTDVLQGVTVSSYLGVVTAEVVYGSNALRDFFAGIRDMIGGRTASYSDPIWIVREDSAGILSHKASQSHD